MKHRKDKSPKTILGLIRASAQKTPIGFGHEASVYNLDDARLEQIVVRIFQEYFDAEKIMEETDELSPHDALLSKRLAPEIARTKAGIGFHPKQEGLALKRWYERKVAYLKSKNSICPCHIAYVKTLSILAHIPQKEYDNFIQDIMELNEEGKSFDSVGDNLMISSKTLRIVDPDSGGKPDNLKAVQHYLLTMHGAFLEKEKEIVPAEIERQIELHRVTVELKLKQAARACGFPITATDTLLKQTRLRFAKDSRVSHIKSIYLGDSPEKLYDLLSKTMGALGWKSQNLS